MCRKCGETDKRGNTKDRRRSRRRLLEIYGNGTVAPCMLALVCGGVLVSNSPGRGYLAAGGKRIPVVHMERDRLTPAGPYALWNLQPACGPCNRARTYLERQVNDGCTYGTA